MKNRKSSSLLLTIAAVTATCLLPRDVMAQIGSSDAATIQNVAPTAAPSSTTTVPLSYGVAQIVQLSQAKVSDDTIVNYIHNSGSSYGMDAGQIIYLKQQGVSDTVINSMLSQPRTAQNVAASTAPADSTPAVSTGTTAPTVAYSQPATTTYVPSSTVYVIPDTQTYQYYATYYRPYYGYYPYYSSCYYPSVTFSFGGGYHGGYYRGGYSRGNWGGYRGGNFHGGWHR
jgi:hypothetical protein